MGCLSTKGMYQRPRADTVSVHFLKRPGGLEFLWGQLHDGIKHSGLNCTRWVWHDACRNPKAKSTQFCEAHPTADVDASFNERPLRAEDIKALKNLKAKRRKAAKSR